VFGVPNLTGATVGVATVSPITGASVPEPSALGLLVIGVAAVATVMFRKPRNARYD
jgi:PEP-CTERM motif